MALVIHQVIVAANGVAFALTGVLFMWTYSGENEALLPSIFALRGPLIVRVRKVYSAPFAAAPAFFDRA